MLKEMLLFAGIQVDSPWVLGLVVHVEQGTGILALGVKKGLIEHSG